ncbi:MAG TPA: Clp protease N-terminal domain-containing protein [Streptosporangiaceae bacterium]|nr:Clp protease N-terminal domain-containing protein [Streptosporangiaceae bacterium]
MPREEPDGSYLMSVRRGFQVARELGSGCRPAHLLAGIAEEGGPAAAALAAAPGRSLREAVAAAGDIPGDSAGYLHGQAQHAAVLFARARGQEPAAAHLLVALLDQGTAEVMRTLDRAGLDPPAVRRAALAVIGAPPGQPRIALPPLDPAGTGDRPPLPLADLDQRAWGALRRRQDQLPVGLVRRPADRRALSRLEQDAAWRLPARLGLGDDQRYSLLWHHDRAVGQRLAAAGADLPGAAPPRRLRAPRHLPLSVPAGWGTWLENRREDLYYRWFRARMLRRGREAPAGL